MDILAKVLTLGVGTYLLVGSILNWDSLLTGVKESRREKLIGRTGNRIFYGFIGTLSIIIGILLFFVDTSLLFRH